MKIELVIMDNGEFVVHLYPETTAEGLILRKLAEVKQASISKKDVHRNYYEPTPTLERVTLSARDEKES